MNEGNQLKNWMKNLDEKFTRDLLEKIIKKRNLGNENLNKANKKTQWKATAID
jgi:hypothetical protein